MLRTIRTKLRGRTGLLGLTVTTIVILFGSVAVGNASSLFGLVPGNTTVLHIQAIRRGPGADASLEAWLDLANYEGKIVEIALDGTVRRVKLVANNAYVLYLPQTRHAVIRRGFPSTSPFATSIRDELLSPRIAAERGVAQLVGTGMIGNRSTDRIQFSLDGIPVIADVDKQTGLMLRVENTASGHFPQQVIEITYPVVEYIRHLDVPQAVFQIDLPSDIEREEYTEGMPQTLGSRLSYAIYMAPASEGKPITAFRRFSTLRGQVSSDAFYLIYRTAVGELQVISSLPPDPATRQVPGRGPIPTGQTKTIKIGNIVWEAEATPGQFRAAANLGDAYVTIFTPNQEIFERVAASLQQLKP